MSEGEEVKKVDLVEKELRKFIKEKVLKVSSFSEWDDLARKFLLREFGKVVVVEARREFIKERIKVLNNYIKNLEEAKKKHPSRYKIGSRMHFTILIRIDDLKTIIKELEKECEP